LQPVHRLSVTELVAIRSSDPLATFLDLNGYLQVGVPMLKRVVALPGQTVCMQGLKISVDAIEIGNAKARDGHGWPLPAWQGRCVVGVHELFLMNWQSEDSLDGRYFGFLPRSSVIGKALPVWTGEESDHNLHFVTSAVGSVLASSQLVESAKKWSIADGSSNRASRNRCTGRAPDGRIRRSGGVMRGGCKPSVAGQEMVGIAASGLRIAKRSSMLCAITAVARKLASILHRMCVS
jgi:type IV secretory pathway protease TraF